MAQPAPDPPDARAWLAQARRHGADTAQALAVFESLDAVPVAAMFGRWRGGEVPTGHPMDGMLTAFGWAGKQACDADTVYPLLFEHGGRTVAIDPRRLPVRLATRLRVQRSGLARGLFRAALPLLRTTRPSARLRMMACRGRVSATMLYDALPIHDAFRRVDRDCLLGLMDCRYFDQPFFFVLERA